MPYPPFPPRPVRAGRGGAPGRAGRRGLAALLAVAVAWASWVGWVHAVLHGPQGATHAGHRHDHTEPAAAVHPLAHRHGPDCDHPDDHAHAPRFDRAGGSAGEAVPAGPLSALFTHEDGGLACDLFDQLTHHDGLAPSAVVIAMGPAALAPPAAQPDGRTVRPAGFRLARGPPSPAAAPHG